MTASFSACGKKSDKSALVGEGKVTSSTEAQSEAQAELQSEENSNEEKANKDDKEKSEKQDKKSDKKESDSKSDEKSQTASEEVEEVTPTFMFFVSKNDTDYDKAMKAVDELKKEYKKKINFDIVDIDENPDAKNNFPVEGNTPTLIMLNTLNDISDFKLKISDKDVMENAIKNALGE